MHVKKILLAIALIVLTFSSVHNVSASLVFKDLNMNDPQAKEVYYLVNTGVISGYEMPDGYYFKPKQSISRAEVAVLIIRALGQQPKNVTKSTFSDVSMNVMTGYIEKAVELGLLQPTSTGKFSPNVAIKRDEMSKVLVKAFKIDTSSTKSLSIPFTDVPKTNPYYEYVSALYYGGITVGIGNNLYGINGEVYRDSFASFVTRIVNKDYTLTKPAKPGAPSTEGNAVGRIYVTTDNLNVRTAASTSASILGKVDTGEKLDAHSVEGNWVKVTYNNQSAYVSKSYVKFLDVSGITFDLSSSKKQTLTSDITLYRGKDISTKVVGALKKGQVINVYGEKDGWTVSDINGIPGYFKSQTSEPTPPVTVQTVGKVATDSLNIRQSASSTSAILGKLASGDIVNVESTDGWWAKINFKGITGYVHKSYLHLMNTSGSSLKNRVIVLDPGHGGHDPGAINGKVYEKDIVLDVSKRLKALLEKAGATVVLTRSDDRFIELDQRPKIADQNFGELFISVHVNSYTDPSANGFEAFYNTVSSIQQKEEIEVANLIYNEILENSGIKGRGVKNVNYAVTRNISMPAILVELGFIKNPEDFKKLTDDKYLQIFAQSMFNGIEQFYKYKK